MSKDATQHLQPGDRVGADRYVIKRLLGEGAQGQTLEADDTRTGSCVAIKRFSVRGAESWKDVELAEREARVLAQLDHPHLPRHVDHFEEDGALYLVMSLVEGDSLESLRRAGVLLDAKELLRLLTELSEVLEYLASKSPPVVHRDIKPGNIIRRPDGGFTLVDFGSVRDHLEPGGSTVSGTFGYMAPEQFQGRAMPVSDVYGLGATLLTLLTGVEPEDQPHKGLGIDVQKALGRKSSDAWANLLAHMLEPNPDDRATDLARWVEELSQPPREQASHIPEDSAAERRAKETSRIAPRRAMPQGLRDTGVERVAAGRREPRTNRGGSMSAVAIAVVLGVGLTNFNAHPVASTVGTIMALACVVVWASIPKKREPGPAVEDRTRPIRTRIAVEAPSEKAPLLLEAPLTESPSSAVSDSSRQERSEPSDG